MSGPRSALQVDIVGPRRKTGVVGAVHTSLVIDGLEISTSRVRSGRVDVDLSLESVAEGIMVSGRIAATTDGDCRRCLEPVSGEIDLSIREIFELHPTEGETWPMADDHIDLEPMVRESVLLALPLTLLCDDECLGPQPDRFPTLAAGDGSAEAEPPVDPRWAALDELQLDE